MLVGVVVGERRLSLEKVVCPSPRHVVDITFPSASSFTITVLPSHRWHIKIPSNCFTKPSHAHVPALPYYRPSSPLSESGSTPSSRSVVRGMSSLLFCLLGCFLSISPFLFCRLPLSVPTGFCPKLPRIKDCRAQMSMCLELRMPKIDASRDLQIPKGWAHKEVLFFGSRISCF